MNEPTEQPSDDLLTKSAFTVSRDELNKRIAEDNPIKNIRDQVKYWKERKRKIKAQFRKNKGLLRCERRLFELFCAERRRKKAIRQIIYDKLIIAAHREVKKRAAQEGLKI